MSEPPRPDPLAATVAAASASVARPSGRLSGFDAMRVRAYQWYILCAALQQAAESMKMLANGWFAFELTGSTAILGLTIFAQAVPQTFLSFFGGVVSDRFPRHRVWQVCNVAALILPLWISAFIFMDLITWHALVAQSFLFGIVLAFRAPARQGIMTEVVGRDKIMSAVSINQMMMNVLQFVGPAGAGFLIDILGIDWAYMIMAVFYVLAILALMPMKYERRNVSLQSRNRGSIMENMKDGFRYVGRTPDVRVVLGLTLVGGIFAMPYNQMLPAFGKTILDTSPSMLGILQSFTAVGAFAGSMTVTLLRPRMRGALFIQTTCLTGVVLTAFVLSNSFALSCIIIVAVGFGQSIRQNMGSTLIQTYTEDAYLGRVLSLNFAQNGLSSMAVFVVAIIAELVGVRYAVLGTAVLLFATGLIWWIFAERLRRLS